jgi:hypothetical protein
MAEESERRADSPADFHGFLLVDQFEQHADQLRAIIAPRTPLSHGLSSSSGTE